MGQNAPETVAGTASVDWPKGTLLAGVALALALLASGLLLVLPVYASGQGSSATRTPPDGAAAPRSPENRRVTLLEVNGPGVLGALGLPVALAALALAASWTTWRTATRALAALLLTVFALITGFSIGLFYLPAAGAMFAAAIWGVVPDARAHRR